MPIAVSINGRKTSGLKALGSPGTIFFKPFTEKTKAPFSAKNCASGKAKSNVMAINASARYKVWIR